MRGPLGLAPARRAPGVVEPPQLARRLAGRLLDRLPGLPVLAALHEALAAWKAGEGPWPVPPKVTVTGSLTGGLSREQYAEALKGFISAADAQITGR